MEDRVLEPLGLTAPEEAAYRLLLRSGSLQTADIAREMQVTRREAASLLEELSAKGLVGQSAGTRPRFIPAPPDAALEILLLRRREELERTRMHIGELVEEFRRRADASNPGHLIEVITGRDAIFRRFNQLQRTASEMMRIFDTPPYASGGGQNEVEIELLARGVVYRTIYSADALEAPGQPEVLREIVAAGEEARLLPELVMRLAIADRSAALIPLRMSGPGTEEGDILVHPSPLLEALITLFDVMWERALPIRFGVEDHPATEKQEELSGEEKELLAMLAADLTEDVIARQLGMARRSAQRRIQRLMQRVGARTRLQLVLLATKRGWI